MVFFAASCAYLGHSNLGSFVVLALRYYVCENICFGTLFVYFSLVGIFFFVCLCVYLCQALFWLLSVLDMQKKKSSKLTRKVLTIFFSLSHIQHIHKCYIIIEWKLSIDAKWKIVFFLPHTRKSKFWIYSMEKFALLLFIGFCSFFFFFFNKTLWLFC